ncbi:alpha/beta fold hydrolase [Luteimonas salinilitoris]|uniref:Alpha/beta fold hydrolase n=1 Tax=Luteimonas salinilitoris TaxID=3237697 RepID=A0ABV4HPZ3_9GAMM
MALPNGRELWVEREGHGEPLVLLAGGPAASHVMFHPFMDRLTDTYEVIYVDYFGRGRSGRPTDWREITFMDDVEDIAGLIETLGTGPVNLYAASYGGLVAQQLVLDRPELVRSLMLVNTLHSPQMWLENHLNINREMANQFPEIWDRIQALHDAGVPSSDPRIQDLFKIAASAVARFRDPSNAAQTTTEPGAFNKELYDVFTGGDIDFALGGEVARIPDFRGRLATVTTPLMIVAGRYDRALYPRLQAGFRQAAPQAEFVMLERSGSSAHVEQPDDLEGLIRRHFFGQAIAAAEDDR